LTVSPAARFELAALVAVLAAAAVVYTVDPAASRLLPPCPLHTLTGVLCPGCGSTRALHALLHGRIASAFGFNALAVLFLPIFVYSFASRVSRLLRGRPLPAPFLKAGAIYALLASIVIFAVARNIPLPPFSALAP
jgi:hypothetical protein